MNSLNAVEIAQATDRHEPVGFSDMPRLTQGGVGQAFGQGELKPQRKATKKTASIIGERKAYDLAFYLTVAYLALEYGRPQNTFPGLAQLHLPGVVTGLLLVALLGSRRVIVSHIQTKLFIGLLIFMAAHVPFAANNYWAYQTTRGMAIVFVAYLAITTFADSLEKVQIMINTWLVVLIYQAINGIIHGGVGIGGFFQDENDLALVLNIGVPFAYFLSLETQRPLRKLMLQLIGVLLAVASIFTFSRGGFVGLVGVLIYCWWKSPGKGRSTFIVATFITAIISFAPTGFWEEIETLKKGRQESTAATRIYLWDKAWKMFIDHPVTGVGPGNFPWNVEKYERPRQAIGGKLHGGRAAHSLYFTLISELAVPGILVFTIMLYSDYRDKKEIIKIAKGKKESISGNTRNLPDGGEQPSKDIKTAQFVALALNGSLVGYLISGAFLSVLYYPNFWIILALGVALKQAVFRSTSRQGQVMHGRLHGGRVVNSVNLT